MHWKVFTAKALSHQAEETRPFGNAGSTALTTGQGWEVAEVGKRFAEERN
jgi:hypothetical protein